MPQGRVTDGERGAPDAPAAFDLRHSNFAIRSTASRRIRSAIGLLLAITIGLGSRKFAPALPRFLAAYAGDTMWAAAVYFSLVLLFPRTKIRHAAIAALLISYADEASQLYHAPWIDSLRATTLGGLILGFGFLCSDIACYTAGVALAAAVDLLLTGSIIVRTDRRSGRRAQAGR